jgi:hypothetical protein
MEPEGVLPCSQRIAIDFCQNPQLYSLNIRFDTTDMKAFLEKEVGNLLA